MSRFESDHWFRRKVIIIPLIVIVMLAIMEVWVVNRLSTYGDQISRLDIAEGNLRMENELLENQIAEKSSLSEAVKISSALGFEKIKSVEFIKQENLAFNP